MEVATDKSVDEMNNCIQKRRKVEDANKATVVLGAQWGDEGKGKLVDLLATSADVVCRCAVSSILGYSTSSYLG